jgi:hypothetical protein
LIVTQNYISVYATLILSYNTVYYRLAPDYRSDNTGTSGKFTPIKKSFFK